MRVFGIRLFEPPHTPELIAKQLIRGLEDGTISLGVETAADAVVHEVDEPSISFTNAPIWQPEGPVIATACPGLAVAG